MRVVTGRIAVNQPSIRPCRHKQLPGFNPSHRFERRAGGAPAVATDSTTVIAGNLTLNKAQALDTACTGATGATVYTPANLSAKPGQCVLYQISVTNVGSANATAVVVSDATPAYTTLSSAPATTVGTIAAGAPAVGGVGTVSANVGTLTPGQAAVLTFGVRITP